MSVAVINLQIVYEQVKVSMRDKQESKKVN